MPYAGESVAKEEQKKKKLGIYKGLKTIKKVYCLPEILTMKGFKKVGLSYQTDKFIKMKSERDQIT